MRAVRAAAGAGQASAACGRPTFRPNSADQGFGQLKLGLMHEILGSSPLAPLCFGNQAPGLRQQRDHRDRGHR